MVDLTAARALAERLRKLHGATWPNNALLNDAATAILALCEELEWRSDLDKIAMDSMLHGTGVMKDGKHVPLSEFYAPPEEPEPPTPATAGKE